MLAFKRMTVHGSNSPVPTWSWTASESRAVRGSFDFEAFNVSGLRLSFVIFELSMAKLGSKAVPSAIAPGNPVCIRDETGRTNPKYSSKHS